MRSRLLEIISECDGLDCYTEQHTNASLDRLAADLRKLDNADRVFAMNLSNRISNRDREAARRLVSMSRTPPKQNPHDPNESVLDIAKEEPLARVGCKGYEDDIMPGIGAGPLFWVGLMCFAWLFAALFVMYGPVMFAVGGK